MKPGKNMEYLIHPKSIALIGASSKHGKPGNTILYNLLKWEGDLFLVNPNEEEIMGKKVFNDIADLPPAIEMAIIALKAAASVAVVKECVNRGFKILIVIAGGFSEAGAGGKALENEIKQAAAEKGVRLLGPNTLGVFIPGKGPDTVFVDHGDIMFSSPGGITLISQSGSVGVEAPGAVGVIGWGLRAFVGIGNRADINEEDLVEFFSHDAGTRCLAFYLETFAHGRKFFEKCKEIVPKKPVVLLKAGRTDMAARAVASHTGKIMAASGRVLQGACKQAGIHLADDEEKLVDYSKILSQEPPACNPKVAIVTSAGGYGIIALDLLAGTRYLKLAAIGEETQKKLKEKAIPFASLNNPIDLTASVDNNMIAHTLDCLEDDPDVGIILTVIFFSTPNVDFHLIDVLAQHRKKTRKPLVVYTSYGPYTNERAHQLYDKGVTAFTSLRRAIEALDILAERGYFLSRG
ncbi:MAG: hypothetical protein GY754_46615 [bacterium]|nr:hypothetical protein [bacterium]